LLSYISFTDVISYMMSSEKKAKKVAIVGSGCTGIGALWALKSTNHEVHLFEAADRLEVTQILSRSGKIMLRPMSIQAS